MKRRNSKMVFVPQIYEIEEKMPKPLIPINWEERYGKDNVRYEEETIYDENGNYVKTITNVYVTMEKVMGFRMFKRKAKLKEENYKIPKLKKLFETSADKKDNEEKTNNELLEIC